MSDEQNPSSHSRSVVPIRKNKWIVRLESILNFLRDPQNLLAIILFVLGMINININVELPVIPKINMAFHHLILILLIICCISIMIDVITYMYKNKILRGTWQVKKIRIILFILLLLLIVVTVYYMQPLIKITSPEDGALINKTVNIEGKAKRIPEGDHIWPVVYGYPPTNRFFPQSQLIYPDPDGRWSIRGINVGVDTDHNMEFDIIILLADDDAHKSLSNYLNESNKLGAWPGLKKIPPGARVLDRITVTRA
jgi:hypothetical protein